MNKYKVLTKEPRDGHQIAAESYEWESRGPAGAGSILMLRFYTKGVTVAEFKADNVVLVQLLEGGAS